MIAKTLIINSFLLLLALPLCSQEPFFREYHQKDPEYNSPFERIYQLNNRQILFGSSQGLFTFNGFDFDRITLGDSLPAHISSLFEDKSGQLWIGLQDGRIFYGRNNNFFRLDNDFLNELDSPVTGFEEDLHGNLWIATYGSGLLRIRQGQVEQYLEEDGIYSSEIYDISRDENDQIWLATDGGIDLCRWSLGKLEVNSLTKEDGLPDDIVRELERDSMGNIWIGTYEGGVCWYDKQIGKVLSINSDWTLGVVLSICIVEGREVWIGTETQGIWRYLINSKRLSPIKGPESLNRSKIYDLHKDLEGNIWVLTNQLGVLAANRQFEYLEISLDNPQALLVDEENRLWMGNQQGLFLYVEEATRFEAVFPSQSFNIISLFEDRYGIIWVGTFGNGLLLFDPATGAIRQITVEDGLSNGSILSIDGADHRIWLATLGGVTEIDNSRNLMERTDLDIFNFDHQSGLGTNFVYQVFLDSRNRAWFATDGNGLCLLENNEIFCYRDAIIGNDTFSIRNVYSITEDRKGGIWFSTPKEGVFYLGNEGFRSFNRRAGLRDLAINGLVTDQNGNILVIHTSGIDLLDPQQEHIIYFDDEVGIMDFEPNLNTFDIDKEGNVWIADSRGLLRYTPMNEDLAIHPMTQITSVSSNLESIDFETNAEFAHHQNQLIISYSGLWYTDPKIVRYRYKLNGFDEDWIYTKDQAVTYSSLPPGKYSFQVMSTENNVFDNEPVERYDFTIRLPFWKEWWFILCSTVLFLGILYLLLVARDRGKQRINRLQHDRIQSQLDALKSQINPHFLFNSFNTLIAIIEEDQEKAVEYVEILSDFYRSILQYREQEVISLGEEIKLVKDYLFLLKMRYGDSLQMKFDTNGSAAFLAPLTLQILVENAVKHNVISGKKPLWVRIWKNESYIIVENILQPKLQTVKSTGFGLSSIIDQYQNLAGKTVVVENGPELFTVKIPILSELGA